MQVSFFSADLKEGIGKDALLVRKHFKHNTTNSHPAESLARRVPTSCSAAVFKPVVTSIQPMI